MTSFPYLEVQGYEPTWQRGLKAVAATHGERLSALVGRRLANAWLLWDRNEDRWFADAPVLLDFSGEQLEVQHQKFDELSLTWNTTDASKPVAFPDFDLFWRTDAVPELTRVAGAVVRAVSLLEWQGGDMADGMVAVRLVVEGEQFTVFNALDENGLAFGQPMPQYIEYRLGECQHIRDGESELEAP